MKVRDSFIDTQGFIGAAEIQGTADLMDTSGGLIDGYDGNITVYGDG